VCLPISHLFTVGEHLNEVETLGPVGIGLGILLGVLLVAAIIAPTSIFFVKRSWLGLLGYLIGITVLVLFCIAALKGW
jgi:hypothetical protein